MGLCPERSLFTDRSGRVHVDLKDVGQCSLLCVHVQHSRGTREVREFVVLCARRPKRVSYMQDSVVKAVRPSPRSCLVTTLIMVARAKRGQ